MRRPNGKLLCSDCNQDRVRAMTPTGLTRKEEKITYGLFKYFRQCGLSRNDAIEKLAFALARKPGMLDRMVDVLDEMRKG